MSKPKSTAKKNLVATINRIRLDDIRPPHDVFNLKIVDGEGVWAKSFGSEADLTTFLEGLQAGFTILGQHILLPRIPEKPTATTQIAAQLVSGYPW